MTIASFDLGTTQLKCVLVNEAQDVLFSSSREIKTYSHDGFAEQSPSEWWEAFLSLSSSFDAYSVEAIIFSGQMQDLIFVDGDGNPLCNAVLYSDHRGSGYVDRIPEEISKKTSIAMDGTIPIAKMLWFKEHAPRILEKSSHLLISAKDYLIYKLTGEAASDATSMSTSGMMDIKTLEYVDTQGIVDDRLFPRILRADEEAGCVLPSSDYSYRKGIPVYCGSGDAGASTLASGVLDESSFSVNLGTSGWISTASPAPKQGVFNLAAVNRGMYVNVIPVLNAGLVLDWVSSMLFPNDSKRYERVESLLSEEPSNSSLLCLPYLSGERFPVSDEKIRGAYIGLDRKTSSSDMARSALEGVAFSLKSGIGGNAKQLSLVGGGASSKAWAQIFSNVFSAPVVTFSSSDILPAIALSSAVLLDMGMISSYKEAIERLIERHRKDEYYPEEKETERLEELYQKFMAIYPALKRI